MERLAAHASDRGRPPADVQIRVAGGKADVVLPPFIQAAA
jgi:hypothetical protein